jgi:hypothetical protein
VKSGSGSRLFLEGKQKKMELYSLPIVLRVVQLFDIVKFFLGESIEPLPVSARGKIDGISLSNAPVDLVYFLK